MEQYALAPSLTRQSCLEDVERSISGLIRQVEYGNPSVTELSFLHFEALLAPFALSQTPYARDLLLQLYTWHGEWLLRNGRIGEVRVLADRALHLVTKNGERIHHWSRAVYLKARTFLEEDPTEGVKVLRTWIKRTTEVEHLHGFYRDMAAHAYAARYEDEALQYSQEALTLASQVDEKAVTLAKLNHAAILTGTRHIDAALNLLPPDDATDTHFVRIENANRWIWALIQARSKQEAYIWLALYSSIIESQQLTHLRQNVARWVSHLD
jgi:hypothetical protein